MTELLNQFDSQCQQLIDQGLMKCAGPDLWIVGANPKHLLSIMIHGNETLGFHLLNDLLSQPIQHSFGLILGNREAVKINKRFVERDLNRSFLHKEGKLLEEQRAKEIEEFAKGFKFILDIHQTSHTAEKEFFLCRNHKESLQMSGLFESSPLVFLRESKMSSEGEGFGSYALHESIPFLTVELGKMGTTRFFDFGKKCIQQYLRYQGEPLPIDPKRDAYTFSHKVKKSNPTDHLIDGVKNFQFISKGTQMLREGGGESPIEGYALFPKYGEYQEFSIDLCQILEKKKLEDVM